MKNKIISLCVLTLLLTSKLFSQDNCECTSPTFTTFSNLMKLNSYEERIDYLIENECYTWHAVTTSGKDEGMKALQKCEGKVKNSAGQLLSYNLYSFSNESEKQANGIGFTTFKKNVYLNIKNTVKKSGQLIGTNRYSYSGNKYYFSNGINFDKVPYYYTYIYK